jgi:hypothetical protein
MKKLKKIQILQLCFPTTWLLCTEGMFLMISKGVGSQDSLITFTFFSFQLMTSDNLSRLVDMHLLEQLKDPIKVCITNELQPCRSYP